MGVAANDENSSYVCSAKLHLPQVSACINIQKDFKEVKLLSMYSDKLNLVFLILLDDKWAFGWIKCQHVFHDRKMVKAERRAKTDSGRPVIHQTWCIFPGARFPTERLHFQLQLKKICQQLLWFSCCNQAHEVF